MSDYNKLTNFATKDSLLTGNPSKIVSGTEIDDEFNDIQSHTLTKVEKNNGTHTGTTTIAIATIGTSATLVGDPLTAFPSGTLMLFQQTEAPTGWTKETTHNDKALRVVSGAVSSGGTNAFSAQFANVASESFQLLATHIPSHTHGSAGSHQHDATGAHTHTYTSPSGTGSSDGLAANEGSTPSANTGSDGSHQHAAAGTHTHASVGGDSGHAHTMDLRVQYVDLIIASKD